jgi:hypothetical protein
MTRTASGGGYGDGVVGAAGVDDEDFVSPGGAVESRGDVSSLVERDDRDRNGTGGF